MTQAVCSLPLWQRKRQDSAAIAGLLFRAGAAAYGSMRRAPAMDVIAGRTWHFYGLFGSVRPGKGGKLRTEGGLRSWSAIQTLEPVRSMAAGICRYGEESLRIMGEIGVVLVPASSKS